MEEGRREGRGGAAAYVAALYGTNDKNVIDGAMMAKLVRAIGINSCTFRAPRHPSGFGWDRTMVNQFLHLQGTKAPLRLWLGLDNVNG